MTPPMFLPEQLSMAAAGAARSPPALRAWRVLVVDDNPDGAEALGVLLESMGCTTAIALDGAHGLAAVAAFDPDLALIDLEMPDMSGCELVRQLRAGPLRSAARLVCLTGHGQPEDRRHCVEAGFDDFFTKPMRPEHLEALLAALHAGREGP